MLADELDYLIGVDPHRDIHALAIVHARSGGLVLDATIDADRQGYAQALRLAGEHAPGRRAFAIEGSGSYGAGLSRFLAAEGERVLEVGRLRREQRSHAKTDALDALRAARSLLGQTRPAQPRRAGKREALRALILTRDSALAAKKAALCQLRALIVTAPEPLRSQLRPLTRARLLARCARLRPNPSRQPELAGTTTALRTLARRAQTLSHEERQLKHEIETLVRALAPALLDETGVGPISAAHILIAWSHRGRFPAEAAFARLAGTAPIPASSGQTIRHRLDPGGDRQLNRALHTIILNRRKNHPATIAYIQRRRSEGKTTREASRCLKRYLARHLYRLLETTAPPT